MINNIKLKNRTCGCFPSSFTIPTAVSNAFSIQEQICKLSYDVNKSLEEVEKNINDVIDYMNSQELEIDKINDLIKQINQDIDDINNIINNINTAITQLEQRTTTNETNITSNTNRIQSLESNVLNLAGRMDSVENIADTNTANIEAINTKLTEYKQDIDENTNNISTILTTIDNINTSISQLQQKTNDLTSRIETLDSNVLNLSSRVDSVETIADKNTNDIKTNSDNILNLSSRTDTLENSLDDLTAKVNNLVEQVNNIINDDLTTINNNIESNTMRIETLEDTIQDLEGSELVLNSYTSRYNLNITNILNKNFAYGWNKTTKSWVNSPTGSVYCTQPLSLQGAYALLINSMDSYTEFPTVLITDSDTLSTNTNILGYYNKAGNNIDSLYYLENSLFNNTQKLYYIIQTSTLISAQLLSNNQIKFGLIAGGFFCKGQLSRDGDNSTCTSFSIEDIALQETSFNFNVVANIDTTTSTIINTSAIDLDNIYNYINSNKTNLSDVVFITDYMQPLAEQSLLNSYNEESLNDVIAYHTSTAKLIKLISLCKSTNINLIVVITYFNYYETFSPEFDYNNVINSNITIKKICELSGIQYLDLANIFINDTTQDPPSFSVWYTELKTGYGNDYYFNSKMYEYMYRYIFKNIKNKLIGNKNAAYITVTDDVT